MTAQWISELKRNGVITNPQEIGLRLYQVTTFGTPLFRNLGRNRRVTCKDIKRKSKIWATPLGIRRYVAETELFQGLEIINVKIVEA